MAEEEQQEVYESVVVQVEETERFGQSLAMAIQRLGREEALKMVQQYFEEGMNIMIKRVVLRILYVFLTELEVESYNSNI